MVPGKAAKLQRVGSNLKKTTFVIYSRKTGNSWDKTFLSGTCTGIVLVTWAGLDFEWDPLTLDHAPFFTQKKPKWSKK